jgi:hypothetical protein
MKKKYNYIPQDDIESITTWEGETIEGDELLDGAYSVKKFRSKKVKKLGRPKKSTKMAKGGMTRKMSLNERAEQLVGSETWHTLDMAEKSGVVAELVNDGVLELAMADGGKSDMFYEGQSIFYPSTKNTKLDKSVRNNINKYADKELVIEKIEKDTPYNTAKCFVRATGEKVIGDITLNPRAVKQYADGGMMAKGGEVLDTFKSSNNLANREVELKLIKSKNSYDVYRYHSNGERTYVGSANDERTARNIFNQEISYYNEKFADGGMMAKGGMVKFEKNGDKLMYFEPINQREVIVAYINNSSKIVTPTGSYYLPNPIAKDVIKWANKNGYEFMQDDKKYADGGMMAHGGNEYEGMYNVIVVAKELEKDGGGKVTFNYKIYATSHTQAQEFAQKMWDKEMGNSDLSLVYIKAGMMADGGETEDPMVVRTQFEEEEFEYADGGGVAEATTFKVSYTEGSKEKEKTFNDKAKAELFVETLQDDDDITKIKMEEIKPTKTEKQSLFGMAKKSTPTTSKKEKESVQVSGIATKISRYDELKAIINNAKAEQEVIGGELKSVGKEKFLELYEERRRKPDNFNLSDRDEKILFIVMDKYKKVEPEKAALLEQFSGLLESVTTYSFNPEVLDRVGDVVSRIILDSKLLSDADKQNLLIEETSLAVKKGSIDRLLDYDNPEEVFNLIEPILALK